MAYSLRGSGKRLRPALVLAVYEATGGRGNASELAAAVEVVHTYSLVHDDLPCMDDDDLRRGRPTTHTVYGVPAATEAGFRMVPLAGRILVRAAGTEGMVGGQVLDLEAEGRALDLGDLRAVHRAKTGALITASAVIGAVAGGAEPTVTDAVRRYADELGRAFQISDDVLDATGSTSQLGKTAGKDARQLKASYSTLLGADRAVAAAEAGVVRAIDHLGLVGIDSTLLSGLARFIVERHS
jgi:geranylgeranyl pyrophosphate synthase